MMTSTLLATNSATSCGKPSGCPPAPRRSRLHAPDHHPPASCVNPAPPPPPPRRPKHTTAPHSPSPPPPPPPPPQGPRRTTCARLCPSRAGHHGGINSNNPASRKSRPFH